jgi:Tol biopolymer transport system component
MPTLNTGARLGGYEIVSVLGAGGMGEVYRARDSKLGREVAIKVILEVFAADPDRVARFEREAKVLASLNHPHIAALYGMEQSGAQHFLVMELVEGQTLADRLGRGPLSPEETLAIALQIADALEGAHEKGIVHRDLKPANVKVTPDDKVKVLDFGLAKAVETEVSSPNAANSPTLSMMASQAGIILGTAAYMSPEQAKGFPADHRSDIFSFGSLLFEMLTGRQPFQGETAPEVLASVLVREPDINRLPPDLNPRLVELVRRCLEKHPKRRWQAIGDVRAELEAIAAAPRTPPAITGPAMSRPLWKRAIVSVAFVVVAAVAAAAAWTLKPVPAPRVTRFSITLPQGQRFSGNARRCLAVSPNGEAIVYAADNQLYFRSLESLQALPLPGTLSAGGAVAPLFSPDSRSVVFYSLGEPVLKRITIAGGMPTTLCPAANIYGSSWTAGDIFFAQLDQPRGILRVPENGGAPELVIPIETDELVEGPQLLPDGDTILFTSTRVPAGPVRWESAQIVAQSMKSRTRKLLITGGSDGRYLPTGHLMYVQGGTVFAVPFNVRRLEKTGPAVPVIQGVRRAPGGASGIADYSVAADGTLVYVAGPAYGTAPGWELVLADRNGTVTPLKLSPGPYQTPRVAPGGTRIALGVDDGKDAFIGVYDIAGTSALRRVTFSGKDRYPAWSPSGRLTYQSGRDGDLAIFWQAADGAGAAERLTTPRAGEVHVPQSWASTPAGDVLLFDVLKGSDVTLWMLSLKDRKIEPFGSIRSNALTSAVFSPDGRWIAYTTRTEPGRSSIYVQPFPATGEKNLVMSSSGASPHHPLWSADGKEIFYVPTLGALESVKVSAQPTFGFGVPQPVARTFQEGSPVMERVYDMMPDGRFLSTGVPGTGAAGAPTQEFQVVLNWFQELKARVPR